MGKEPFYEDEGSAVTRITAVLRRDTRTLGQWGIANDGPGGLANILVLLFY